MVTDRAGEAVVAGVVVGEDVGSVGGQGRHGREDGQEV